MANAASSVAPMRTGRGAGATRARSFLFSDRGQVGERRRGILPQVGERELFQADVAGLERRVDDRAVQPDQQSGLPRRAGDLHDSLALLDGRGVLARADQDLVLGQQVLDVAAQLDPGRGQHDQVVADPLQVRDQVRGQDHGQAARGYPVGQQGEEVPPGQRVERGDRLIQQQQPGLLGQDQGQRDLGPLTSGQLAHRPVQRDLQGGQPLSHRFRVPARVQVPARADVVLG